MLNLEIVKFLAPVDGLTGVVGDGKVGSETGMSVQSALPSFKQLLQSGAARLAVADATAGGYPQSPRAESSADELSERPATNEGSAAIPASGDGTIPQSDAVRLDDGTDTATSIAEAAPASSDEEPLEMVWPGLSLCLASRAALRNTDSPKEEGSPPAEVVTAPDAELTEPVSLVSGPMKPFAEDLEGAESTDSAARPPISENTVSTLEIGIDNDPLVPLGVGGEPVVVAETAETEGFFDSPSLAARNVEASVVVRTPHPGSSPHEERASSEPRLALKDPSASPTARHGETSPPVETLPTPAGARSAEAPPLVKASRTSPVPVGLRSAEPPMAAKELAPAADRNVEASVVARTPHPGSSLDEERASSEPRPALKEAPPVREPIVRESPVPATTRNAAGFASAKETAPPDEERASSEPRPALKESPSVREPIVRESPVPATTRNAEGFASAKETAPAVVRATPEARSVITNTPIVETTGTQPVIAERIIRSAPIIESVALPAGKPPDRAARSEARGGGQSTMVVLPAAPFQDEEEADFITSESRIVDRERAAAIDPGATRAASERFGQMRPAQPFSEIESFASAPRRPVPLPETRFATTGPTMPAHPVADEPERPTLSANPNFPPFATIQPSRHPAPPGAIVSAEEPRFESTSRDSAIGRTGGPDAPPAGHATSSPAVPPPATPARPDAGILPTFPRTAPEIVNLLQKNWGWMLGRQLQWMIGNRLHEAKIDISPPHLGPLEVRISLQQNQTNVAFFSHEAAVRETLENAMPRLRELLDGQGFHLNQAQVSDQSLSRHQSGWGEQAPRQRGDGSAADTGNRDAVADDADKPRSPTHRPQGMVDHYV